LIDIDAYQCALPGKLPESSALGHDIVDGLLAGRAVVGDAFVFDNPPSRMLAAFAQRRRWIRGAVQHLPWLLPWVRQADGARRRNPLPVVDRALMATALLRTAVPVTSLVLTLAGWTLLGGSALVWTLLAFVPHYFHLLAEAVERAIVRTHAWLRGETSPATPLWIRAMHFRMAGWSITNSAHDASLTASAAGRAIWRAFVSHRRLLDWRTQQSVSASTGTDLALYWREFLPSMTIGLGALVAATVVRPASLFVAAPIATAWLGAFAVCWYMDQPAAEPISSPTSEMISQS
jgi:cyclic beta-1,2-glucan synthetase